jgi:hypothetical protein
LYDQYIQFDPRRDKEWQQKCIIVEPIKPVYSIGILLIFRGPHSGTVYFDDISLWNTTGIPQGIRKQCVCRRSTSASSEYGNWKVIPNLLKAEEDPVRYYFGAIVDLYSKQEMLVL